MTKPDPFAFQEGAPALENIARGLFALVEAVKELDSSVYGAGIDLKEALAGGAPHARRQSSVCGTLRDLTQAVSDLQESAALNNVENSLVNLREAVCLELNTIRASINTLCADSNDNAEMLFSALAPKLTQDALHEGKPSH